MPPRQEDPLQLVQGHSSSYRHQNNSWAKPPFCPLVQVELLPLHLRGPTVGQLSEKELKEWIWLNHKDEIRKSLRVCRPDDSANRRASLDKDELSATEEETTTPSDREEEEEKVFQAVAPKLKPAVSAAPMISGSARPDIENHISRTYCSGLKRSVIQVGHIAREFEDAIQTVEGLRLKVRDIQETMGARSRTNNRGGTNAAHQPSGNKNADDKGADGGTGDQQEVVSVKQEQSLPPPRPASTCCHDCSTDLQLYKKRWELMDRVARATQNFLQNEGSRVVYKCLLDGILELEESEYGFIGEVRKDPTSQKPYIQIHASTAVAHASKEAKQFFENNDHYKFTNLTSLFGKIYTQRKPVISNNVQEDMVLGCPHGHPMIENFLGLPLYGKSRGIPPRRDVIGILCIGNKKGGYSLQDVSFLEPFTATGSNLIQAYWQLEENTNLINDLECKVRERTQSLQETNQQLAKANHLVVQTSRQQIQHFACMSHEIRTPLNCIIGLSSLLQGTEMSPMQKENMQMITASGNLLLNVVNDVLDFSKLATGNLEIDVKRSNLQEALDATVHAIDMKARTRYLSLKTVYDPQLPEYVCTDTHRLQQILFNLLGNAVKFSNKGGVIELLVKVVTKEGRDLPQLRLQELSHTNLQRSEGRSQAADHLPRCPFPTIQIQHHDLHDQQHPSVCPHNHKRKRSQEPQQPQPEVKSLPLSSQSSSCATQVQESLFIRFVVKDYGKGIKSSELQNIFKPFRQESVYIQRNHGGTGLGLSITAKLVEALGGQIFVDSELGAWTEFTVDIPLQQLGPDEGTKPINPLELGQALGEETVVAVVARDSKKTSSTLKNIFAACNINCSVHSQVDDLLANDNCIIRNSSRLVCLIHEELFDRDKYRKLTQMKPQTTLISYGQSHATKESSVHVRSPTALLPCVLVSTIQTALKSSEEGSSDDPGHDTPPPPSISSSLPMSSEHCEQAHHDITELRVLVAEDNLINQKVMSRMLKKLGVQKVDMVKNGLEAVNQVDAQDYDVVLMDMQMPIMDGIQACRIIVGHQQSKKSKVKVVFVSANVSCENEMTNSGAWDCVPKPFKLENIRDCLTRVALATA